MILFLFCIRDLTAISKCKGNHTVLAFNNECVCIDGFPFGDPNSNEGCYRCSKKCHQNAKCEYPGSCICTPPYHGNGVDCFVDIPHITSFSPINGSMRGGTKVQIHYTYSGFNNNNIPDYAFCRFGPLVVRSEFVSDTTITCQTPPHSARPAFLSVSFNTIGWSKEDVFFNYVETIEIEEDDETNKDSGNDIDNNNIDDIANDINNQKSIEDENKTNANKNIGLVSVSIISFILLSSLFLILLQRLKVEKLPFALRRKAIMD